MKKHIKNLAMFISLSFALGIVGCGAQPKHHSHVIDESYIDEEGNLTEPIDIATHTDNEVPESEYQEGVVLVKTFEEIDYENLDLEIRSVEEIYTNSPWKKITLDGETAFDAVKYLRSTGLFDKVDYDYIMRSEADIDAIDVSLNPRANELPYIESMGVGDAWGYCNHNGLGGTNGGGSQDVVVAVLDTGVDYNHIDLANNIWVNTGEIPGNGIDDDGNGYIDDVRGWDCVNNDNDPMDDNGHGTHVAGIIAAENNNIGTVGVAFNCKIMPVKTGTSSGTLNNSDIAEAVRYAYMNGASVINMSFGGPSISLSVQDALEDAYNQCVLVAAAGNNGMCNQPGCLYCTPNTFPIYPGCLPYTVGVMSCNSNGTFVSSFSNYDHTPYHYNKYEYDCFACGEQILSTWPNNKLAKMSGTSMATPVVAGIAALLRSAYPDRDVYSNKYIHSQLSNTGPQSVTIFVGGAYTILDQYHPFCNAFDALTRIPKPAIHSLYDWYTFDNIALSTNNNNDGFIDAGETIKLGIELENRGGKASNVVATINTSRNGDPNIVDPNVEILQDTINFGDVGTYSVGDGGKIYDGNKVVDVENGFVIKVSQETPNGYVCYVNLEIDYLNGLQDDGIIYHGSCALSITVSSGCRLSGIIQQDTTFTADKAYIISDSLIIPGGVTVAFEAGCKISFYSNSSGYIGSTFNTPHIDVYGTLLFNGTAENNVELSVNPIWEDFFYIIEAKTSDSIVIFNHAKIDRMIPAINSNNVRNSRFEINNSIITFDKSSDYVRLLNDGMQANYSGILFKYDKIDNCFFDIREHYGMRLNIKDVTNSILLIGNDSDPNDLISFIETNGGSDSTGHVFENNLVVMSSNTNASHSFSYGAPHIEFGYCHNENGIANLVKNNSFITDFVPKALSEVSSMTIANDVTTMKLSTIFTDNSFADIYKTYENSLILNNLDRDNNILLDVNDSGDHNDSLIWPYITDISIINSDNDVVHTVGTETNTVRVTFSREMDTSNDFSLLYGSWKPYADYEIHGDYVSDTVWEGEMQVKASIEGGIQYFSSKGGCAKDDSFKTLFDNAGAFTFNIDTAQAYAMNLQASNTNYGVELSWVQDDYETLMGYNIYRSDSKDGNYSRINSSLIPSGENTYIDNSCQPGKTYWYTFTVVLSDFSESAPAGKVSITTTDTINPTIYHTPVNQGYAGNNLSISCSASDNVAVTSATLYYRTVGETVWKSLPMAKNNDRYSATIFGSEVTITGLEYYIEVSDGTNTITRGSSESPFVVIVKDPSTLNNIGDVDGDGVITTKDALMIIRAINDELILTDDQFHRADLNKDNVLSTFEALRILQYINGNVTTLEM